MPDNQLQTDTPDGQVAVTLQLDAKVYQAFQQKAEKAGLGIEQFLSSTLSIVLGCRVFNETHSCSPQISVMARAPDEAQKTS